MFVEARNENSEKNFITVDIKVNSLIDNLPRFERDKTSGPISLSFYENASLYQSILDLESLVYIPNENFYFYVFDKGMITSRFLFYLIFSQETNQISETFSVNTTRNFWLQPIKKLNSQLINIYKLFIYVTDTPKISNSFYDVSNSNRAILFVNIKVLEVDETELDFSQNFSKFIGI